MLAHLIGSFPEVDSFSGNGRSILADLVLTPSVSRLQPAKRTQDIFFMGSPSRARTWLLSGTVLRTDGWFYLTLLLTSILKYLHVLLVRMSSSSTGPLPSQIPDIQSLNYCMCI